MSKVYISPSMQEHNSGAVPGYIEENVMSEIGDIVVSLLQYNHIEVYRNNPSWSLGQAVTDSNSKSVDLHVALHSNAGGGRGAEIYHYPGSSKGVKAATAIYKHIEPITPTADRGLKATSSLYEIKNTKAPAVLLEVEFHDSVEGATWIMNNKEPIAAAVSRGICDYLGIEFSMPQVQTASTEAKWRVCIGAFANIDNAKVLEGRAKQLGFDAYIVPM